MTRCVGSARPLHLLLFVFGSFFVAQVRAGGIHPDLLAVLASAGDEHQITAIARLNDRVEIIALSNELTARRATREERYQAVLAALQQKAATTQGPLLSYLEQQRRHGTVAEYEGFWIDNLVMFRAEPSVIHEVAFRSDVEIVFAEPEMVFDPPIDPSPSAEAVNSTEVGLRVINAPRLWALGFTGIGRLVLGIDTGVNGNHAALASRWRGTLPGVQPQHAWYGSGTFPVDSDNPGHGTHTMGTMVGRNAATQDTLGVAPDAYWIAGTSNYAGAFQWSVNPDGNPTTMDDVPDVINCSWFSSGDQCFGGSGYWSLMDNAEAAGIVVVWSAGNCGPSGSASNCASGGVVPGPYKTITPPKNRVASDINAFSVGALDGANVNLPIATFSSRGPSACDTTFKKPNVAAPGVNVRSTYANGGYGNLSGTSMAAPHVSGAVALLRQVNPQATVDEIKLALMETARDLGEPGRDNSYGTGVIDVFAAAGKVSPYQVRGIVRDLDSQQPIALANVEVIQTGQQARTTLFGSYEIGPLKDSVQIRFSAYAHFDTVISRILVAGVIESLHVSLRSFAHAPISGAITDAGTSQGIQAEVLLYGYGDPTGGPTYTSASQPNGSYAINAAIGQYQVVVRPPVPYPDRSVQDSVSLTQGGVTVDFSLSEASVLLVDDDGAGGYESLYRQSLDRLGITTRTFSVADSGATPAGVLGLFTRTPALLWFTGDETTGTLTPDERRVILGHLTSRGNAIITGQNIAQYSPAGDTLLEQYLGISWNGDQSALFARGFPGDIIGNGMNLAFSAGAGNQGSKDKVQLLGTGIGTTVKTMHYATIAADTTALAGVRTLGPGNTWGVAYFAFGLEGVSGVGMDSLILRSMRFFQQQVVDVPDDGGGTVPRAYLLEQNYPNPFNPLTTIAFQVPEASRVVLRIYNIIGQEVATLLDGEHPAGRHTVVWNGRTNEGGNAASGMYFYSMTASSEDRTYSAIKKMVLIR